MPGGPFSLVAERLSQEHAGPSPSRDKSPAHQATGAPAPCPFAAPSCVRPTAVSGPRRSAPCAARRGTDHTHDRERDRFLAGGIGLHHDGASILRLRRRSRGVQNDLHFAG